MPQSTKTPLPRIAPLPISLDTSDSVPLFARVRMALGTKIRNSLDPRQVRPMPNQPRGKTELGSQEYLALDGSLRSVGQIDDAIVRRIPPDEKGREYELVDGEGRWQSALAAGEKLSAVVIQSDDTAVAYLIAGIVNMNRRDYAFGAKSDFIHRMNTDPGSRLTHKQIGLLLGIHAATVEKFHALQRLSRKARHKLGLDTPGRAALNFDALIVLARLSGKDEMETEELQLRWANIAVRDDIRSASELSERIRAERAEIGERTGAKNPVGVKSGTPRDWQLALRFAKATTTQARRLEELLRGKTLPNASNPISPVYDVAAELRKAKRIVDGLLGRFP